MSLATKHIFLDAIITFFISSSISLILVTLPILYSGIGTGETFVFVAIWIFLFLILRLRRWLAPLTIAIALSAFSLYYIYNEALTERLSYLAQHGIWLFSGAPECEIFSNSAELLYISHSIIFFVTLASYFILRRFYSIWLLIAAFLGVAVLAGGIYGHHLSFALFAIGIISLLPRTYFKLFKKSKKEGSGHSQPQLIAVPIATLIVLLSLVISPPSASFFRWYKLANTLEDIGHIISPAHNEATRGFDMYALGFGASPDRLGGPVTLTDGYILSVTSNNTPTLLRGSVMGYYTGYRWLPIGYEDSLRFNSLFWRDDRTRVFGFDLPIEGEAAFDAFYAISNNVTMSIIYATEFYTTVFSGSGLRDVSFTSSSFAGNLRFNSRSELYMPTPIPVGEVVTLHARVIDRNAPYFYENILHFENSVNGDPHYRSILERYTVLPENLPDIVRDTALYVVGDETSPFLKATALATWLGENFYYTLEPVVPPEDMDFVAHFLETREGHCVYYATAMAVMARTLGIPSRYVMGFGLISSPTQNNVFYATGRTAHAWAEIYIYGLGWVPFDPLDWNPGTQLYVFYDIGDFDYYYYWMSRMGDYIHDGYDIYNFEQSDIMQYILTAFTLLSGVAVLVLIIFLHSRRKYSANRVFRKFPNLADRFSFYFSDIISTLRMMGLGIEPGETLARYDKRISSQIVEQGMKEFSFSEVIKTQMSLHFADISPSAADVETARDFHAMLVGKQRKNTKLKET